MQERDGQKKYIHHTHTERTGIRVEKTCILYIHGENNDKANQKGKNHNIVDCLRAGRLAFYCPKGVVLVHGETMAISNSEYM